MKLKNTLIISSYVLLAALLFSGSYVIGKTSIKKTSPVLPKNKAEEAVDAITDSTAEQTAVPESFYEVTAEEGKVVIYRCTGSDRTVVADEEISESVFPKDDIEELKRGVRFDSLDRAQELFENFVS